MPWQKLISHVSDSRVVVRSRKGNEYPVDVEHEYMGEAIYTQLINQAHDDVDFWAWIDFDGDDGPVLEDWTRGTRPEKPPWEH